MSESMPAEIAKALVNAQGVMRRVGHDGTNQLHRYKYTSAEALIDAAREPMRSAGLALVQCGWDFVAPAGPEMPARLTVRYMLTSAGGASWELPPSSTPVIPEKGRPWDKAEAAALTYSLGYTLRGLLKIARTDADDDVDQRDDSDAPRRGPDASSLVALFAAANTQTQLAEAREITRGAWGSLDQPSRDRVGKAQIEAKARIEAAKAA